MLVGNKHYRTIWINNELDQVQIIDQRPLPHEFVVETIDTVGQMAVAIRDMHVRGAGLIGAAAGYGMYLAARESAGSDHPIDALQQAARQLKETRPTAVNLSWAVDRQLAAILSQDTTTDRIVRARKTAGDIANEDARQCQQIGQHGLKIIQKDFRAKQDTVHILTHCNAGWLAFVDHGSATGPIYAAHEQGIPIHIWVDETRPRNQGARLTAWELGQHGVDHTIITDNAGGHLMQHGRVDLVIVGTDRTTRTGDVANKIGTYLKALAAFDNDIPFYVAAPSSSIDWTIAHGLQEIPIEERNPKEVKYIRGLDEDGIREILLAPLDSQAANYAFDVTPARLVSGLITERGVCRASESGLKSLFPEKMIRNI